MLLCDRLSEHMGVATNGTSLGNRRDKHAQQQAVRDAGMRSVRECCSTEWSVIESWMRDQPLPVVLKPVESAGSDGVKLCGSLTEARQHFKVLMAAQRKVGALGGVRSCGSKSSNPPSLLDPRPCPACRRRCCARSTSEVMNMSLTQSARLGSTR